MTNYLSNQITNNTDANVNIYISKYIVSSYKTVE